MPLNIVVGNDYYFGHEYKTIVRSCKELLLARAGFHPFMDPGVVFAYRYNFHKFLRSLRDDTGGSVVIDDDLVWTISFINGIENPNADFSKLTGIYTVTKEDVDAMIQTTRVRRE